MNGQVRIYLNHELYLSGWPQLCRILGLQVYGLRQQFMSNVNIVWVFLASIGRHNAPFDTSNMFPKSLLLHVADFAV